MIVRKHLDFRIVIKVAWKRLLSLFLLSSLVTLAYHLLDTDVSIDSLPASILGVALAILLGFRINSAYERWWEARRIWGAIVNDSRSIARQVMTFFSDKNSSLNQSVVAEEKRTFLYRQIAFVYALKGHLRKTNFIDDIKPFLTDSDFLSIQSKLHLPNAILLKHAAQLEKCSQSGVIEDFRHMQIDNKLSTLCDSMGACERIKNTVFPRQYSYYTTLFIAIYTHVLPFIFVAHTGWFTIPFTLLVGFIFFALDSIARGIENPFENTYNDTPMNSICRTIENNIREMLEEKDLLPAVQPVNGFLF